MFFIHILSRKRSPKHLKSSVDYALMWLTSHWLVLFIQNINTTRSQNYFI